MKTFEIPEFYRSAIITRIKQFRKVSDPRKKDLSPVFLDFGPVGFYIARHFGFCYGVENAIEISFKAIEENKGKNIYLLSQMIHNPEVNKDLTERGVKFLQDTSGKQLISFDVLKPEDVVIIPAFGATLQTEKMLQDKGIRVEKYNTTCPFVEKVWNRSEKLGLDNFSIIIHGKYNHEETRATFSRSERNAHSVIVKDMEEAKLLGKYITGEKDPEEFKKEFAGKYSEGFDVRKDLNRVGVINQTTMLATETAEIAEYFRKLLKQKFGEENAKAHFADTRDTLCYATNENQDATLAMLETDADLAIVIGGYNSSNTSHLVELLERKFPVYFISGPEEIESKNKIDHFIYHEHKRVSTENFLPPNEKIKIILSSGASCPDSIVENVLRKILSYFPEAKSVEEAMKNFSS
jgi:4-hydroxy-3-methylbut-2-en-1-yl diphosphate reductase